MLGEDRNLIYANAAAAQMLCTESPELVGMGVHEFARRFRVSYPSGALVPPGEYASQRAFDAGERWSTGPSCIPRGSPRW